MGYVGSQTKSSKSPELSCQCGGCLGILLLNLTIGGLCFDYVLEYLCDKDIPWYADSICGLFLGELAIPATFICYILELCGLSAPLFG